MTTALTTNTIEGTLVYVCVQQPQAKYQSTDKEYKCGIVVDEDTADAWNERFGKQPTKVVKTSDFKDEFKIDAPFPDAKKQYVINLKKPAQYADGNPLPNQYKPKVLLQDGNTAIDVTDSQLPSNGSYGKVSFETRENSYGTFAKLKNVLVEKMIEYKKGGGVAGGEFGLEVQGSQDFVQTTKQEVKEQPTVAPKTEPTPTDLDQDLPF